MTYLAPSRRSMGDLSFDSILDTVKDAMSNVLTLGGASREQNKANPVGAVQDYFTAYRGNAPAIGGLVSPDGDLQTKDFASGADAQAWLQSTDLLPKLYAAVWDRQKNDITVRGATEAVVNQEITGIVGHEQIQVTGRAPGTNWTTYIIGAGLLGAAYWYFTKKKR